MARSTQELQYHFASRDRRSTLCIAFGESSIIRSFSFFFSSLFFRRRVYPADRTRAICRARVCTCEIGLLILQFTFHLRVTGSSPVFPRWDFACATRFAFFSRRHLVMPGVLLDCSPAFLLSLLHSLSSRSAVYSLKRRWEFFFNCSVFKSMCMKETYIQNHCWTHLKMI